MSAQVPERVTGVNLELRLVSLDDADYIHALRTDPKYNAHLSTVTGTAEDQRRWIETYKHRETEGREAYYVIERRRDGQRCGVVRLYNITSDRFTWGSWILDESKPPKAALESAVLIYDIGFRYLALTQAIFDVRKDNDRTLAFHRRFGAVEIGDDDQNIFFVYSRDRFVDDRSRHMQILTGIGEA